MKEFKGYKKGVNLGGWLSQSDYAAQHLATFITEEDISRIASWGVDHVRLPVDYNVFEEKNGQSAPGYGYIEKTIEWCKKYGLNMVLDLHKTFGFSFDDQESESGFFESKTLQEQFYALWEEFAKRYGSCGNVAFELLNEVTDKKFCAVWNGIIRECISRIRKYAPDRIILVGGYWQNSPDAVPDLDAPYDDKVVYNCHCYAPLEFTHQGGEWVKELDPSVRLSFDECGITAELFRNIFKNACAAAEKNDTCLYCGEYGVIDRAQPQDILKWYKTINSVFEELGISRCAWNYKEKDFGLSDKRMEDTIPELAKYL